jgi:hypothetical protein
MKAKIKENINSDLFALQRYKIVSKANRKFQGTVSFLQKHVNKRQLLCYVQPIQLENIWFKL